MTASLFCRRPQDASCTAAPAIDKISDNSFKEYDLAVVKFTISTAGEIVDAHVFDSPYQTFKNEKTTELLLKAVRNMPCWTPAAHPDGTPAKQEFVLTVGNMESCVTNLLSIQQDRLPEQH